MNLETIFDLVDRTKAGFHPKKFRRVAGRCLERLHRRENGFNKIG